MSFQNLVLLAPCHGIEDFPLYHTGDDAASLLACWTSLWHPTLLSNAKKLPRVERCDYPPDDLSDSLFVLPAPCVSEMSESLPDEIAAAGALLIREQTTDRDAIVRQALEHYPDACPVDAELVQDFLALGFVLLQVELLTQQMRYASSIDQSRIERLVFEAASLAVKGETVACRDKLVLCHDALADERSHYYPVDVYFLDLTLLAEPLAGALWAECELDVPKNVIASAQTIDAVWRDQEAIAKQLQSSIASGQLGIAGGEYDEQWLPLLSPETAVRQLQHGLATWQNRTGNRPTTFARRLNGIYPSLLYLLRNCGFQSSLHMRFDEGKYPESSQSKTSWNLAGEYTLPTLGKRPLDANVHHTFLELPRELSEAMDTDFVAARTFWHWPGHTVPWFEDLRRGCKLGTALGKFVTLHEFFAESPAGTASDSFSAAHYRYPYLRQSALRGHADPLGRFVDYWHRSVNAMMLRGSIAMTQVLGTPSNSTAVGSLETQLDQLDKDSSVDQELNDELTRTTAVLGRHLIPSPPADHHRTILNPLPFARRVFLSDLPAQAVGASVYASSNEDGVASALVDVPAMGFASIELNNEANSTLAGPHLADGMEIQNEFLHATIDEVTGTLRSLRDHRSRTTLASQQVGLRISLPKTGQPWIDRKAPVGYSVMAADRVEVTANGQLYAEIATEGRMLAPNGDIVGEFQQRYQLTRGSRILGIEIEITPHDELLLAEEPWDSYYACRLAFADPTAILVAGRHLQAVPLETRRIEAPLFVDVDTPSNHITLFTCGLPFHRRVSDTQLDTLLLTSAAHVTGNDAASSPKRRFRMGIGVDVTSPVSAALDWMAQSTPAIVLPGKPQNPVGWLFHATAKNVLVSNWQLTGAANEISFRLVETKGRRAKFLMHACRPWQHVQQVMGDEKHDMPIADGAAKLVLEPHEIADFVGQVVRNDLVRRSRSPYW